MVVNTVQLGKDYYSLQGSMVRWCNDYLGENPAYKDWVWAEPVTWEGLGNWCVSSMFGNTFFYFKNPSDATAFKLKWV